MIFLPLLSRPLPLEALLAAPNSLPPLSLHANSLPACLPDHLSETEFGSGYILSLKCSTTPHQMLAES